MERKATAVDNCFYSVFKARKSFVLTWVFTLVCFAHGTVMALPERVLLEKISTEGEKGRGIEEIGGVGSTNEPLVVKTK